MDKAKFFASAALMEQDDAVLALLRKKLVAARQEGNTQDEDKFIDALMNKILIQMPKHPLTGEWRGGGGGGGGAASSGDSDIEQPSS